MRGGTAGWSEVVPAASVRSAYRDLVTMDGRSPWYGWHTPVDGHRGIDVYE